MSESAIARPVLVEQPERPTDSKGRPEPLYMSEKEMLEEIVRAMRTVGDAMELISKNPMLSAMVPGLNTSKR